MKHALFFATLIMSICACDLKSDNGGPVLPDIDLDLPTLNTKPGNFSSCGEIALWRAQKIAQWNYYNPQTSDIRNYPNSLGWHSATVRPTNAREIGIDEPDMVKTDERSIFVARTQSVEIVNQDSLLLEQTLELPQMKQLQLYFAAGRLVVLGYTEPVYTPPAPEGYLHPLFFTMVTYRRDSSGQFALETSQTLPGNLVGAGLSGDTLFMVTQEYLNWSDGLAASGGNLRGIPCTNFMKPLFNDFSQNVTYIHRVDLNSPAMPNSQARFGRTDSIYMNANNLYLIVGGFDWIWRDPRYSQNQSDWTPVISKFSLANGTPAYAAAGSVQGYLRNDFTINEDASGKLTLATTLFGSIDQSNELWTLNQNGSSLDIIGLSDAFAPGETIRAVRFLNGKAYVVTFRNQDPLFVFDLTDPHHPQLQAEVDVPGFSAYLHPLADGSLFGIGYQTDSHGVSQGIQASIFRLDPSGVPSVVNQQSYGSRGSLAYVTADDHAISVDPDTGEIAIPVRLYNPPLACEPYGNGTLELSGAIILHSGAPLSQYAKVSHYDMIPDACKSLDTYGASWWNFWQGGADIQRVFHAGKRLISVSIFGVRAGDPDANYATGAEIKFPDADDECARLRTPIQADGL